MAVVVVARWRARPGQEAALVAGALTLWREFYGSCEPAVFRVQDDPRTVLYIDEWNRPGEYRLRQSNLPARLDALCTLPVARSYFRELHRFERAPRPAPVVGAALYSTPPSAARAAHQYLTDRVGPTIEAQPGCLQRRLFQDLEDPGRLLVIVGYRSVADRDTALRTAVSRGHLVLRPLGTRIESLIAQGGEPA